MKLQAEERIYVAGHRGMVGSAIVRQLESRGARNILTRTHAELDLSCQQDVRAFLRDAAIDRIIIAAAKVGGIHANNTYPAEFIYTNLMIQANLIHQAYLCGVKNLLFLGSSCIYPKFAPQPMVEEHLLTDVLEPTNEPYAVAKIAGIKMCEAYNRQYKTSYRSVMPTNLYGPGDNYNLQNSHVIPAMIRKYHLARLAEERDLAAILANRRVYGPIPKDIEEAIGFDSQTEQLAKDVTPKVILWGSGTPKREFLHVDDMAAACLHVLELDETSFGDDDPSFLNIGTGKDISIAEVASIIADLTGFSGKTVYDAAKPDGTPRKLLDTSRINRLGWQPQKSLREGLEDAFVAYGREIGS